MPSAQTRTAVEADDSPHTQRIAVEPDESPHTQARWTICINGCHGRPDSSLYENVDGVMPIDGSYSINYVGYGTSFTRSFFHGSMSDLRLYERALDIASIRAIFLGDACCSLSLSAGTYIDQSKPCTGKAAYNTEFCRTCKADCGPLHFIDNEANVCNGQRSSDFTLCKPCAPCAQDQYLNR
jgi:hypothetical protein